MSSQVPNQKLPEEGLKDQTERRKGRKGHGADILSQGSIYTRVKMSSSLFLATFSFYPAVFPDDLLLGQPSGHGAALGEQGNETFDIIGKVRHEFFRQLGNPGLNR